MRNSNGFSSLLVAVLTVGNYLNLGTTNGAAVAFKLQALTKLADTKSIDGDESLMSFLATSLLDSGLPALTQEVPSYLSGWMETTIEVRWPVVPVQIEKLRIFRTIFWVSLRENYQITGSTGAAPHARKSP